MLGAPLIHLSGLRRSNRTDQRLLVQMSARLRLPLFDRTQRRRRRSHRHHRTADHRRRRSTVTGRPAPRTLARTGSAATARLTGAATSSRGVDTHHVLRHRTRVHKRVMRHDRHAIVHTLIHIGNVVDRRAPVDDHGVVDVRHLRDIHRRVGDVHVVHVPAAHAIPRHVDFSRSQREPSHADAGREVESRAAADETPPGRRPHRTHHDRSRNPEPSAVHERPASVVERSESPRLVFHPRPAPGTDIDPVTEAIRSPSRNNRARTPARTISGDIVPVAVFVQVFVPGHFAGNIVRRIGAIFAIVAIKRPAVKIVAIGESVRGRSQDAARCR